MSEHLPIQYLDGEEWRPVVGHEHLYHVSNFGRVKRLAGTPRCPHDRLLNPGVERVGYYVVGLSMNGKNHNIEVHRLVATAFIGERPYKHEVNHIDGNKLNNNVSNLEYVTRSENGLHAYRVLKRSVVRNGGAKGEEAPSAKLTSDDVRAIRRMNREGARNVDLARLFNVSQSRITRIIKRQQWKHLED